MSALNVRRAEITDGTFVRECLTQLWSRLAELSPDFDRFWDCFLAESGSGSTIWIGELAGERVGMVTANRFAMPRYLGFGVELEEVVVLPAHQKKGIGSSLIEAVVERYAKEQDCRKVLVKTDDVAGSGRLYARLFQETALRTYQKYLHRV